MEKLLTLKELADELRVSTATIRRMIQRKQIPYFRISDNGNIRFSSVAVMRWIRDQEYEYDSANEKPKKQRG